MYISNRLSLFDKFPTLNIASALGHPNHVTGRMVHGVPMFDGGPLSAIDYVEYLMHMLQERRLFT